MLTFQQIIHRLTTFWIEQGCVFQQGHDLEIGAGTFNPSTFLRVLGPKPFKTVYVEPSRRPQDGRFGNHPNRLQLFHQLQVIMKPSPLESQELYLKSLQVMGLDLSEHDVRFVHDDWEAPTLGAWGLGWEVWLNGMEVTQFTYFQVVGGCSLAPISVELTYGLERLCMILQEVDNFFDIQWNDTFTYGELFHQSEVEWSHYNFSHASTKMWLRHFEDFEEEARALLTLHLPIPAYDFVMKMSHAFNILEARGILSVTERTGYIKRMRDLAKTVATTSLQSREKLTFPLLPKQPPPSLESPPKQFNPEKCADFLLEIGSEQVPPAFVSIGCRHLEREMVKLLSHFNLTYTSLATFGTPRRLSILIKGLVEGTKEEVICRKGPPLSTVFDKQGELTKQGKGFLHSVGITSPLSLQEIETHTQDKCSIQRFKEVPYLMAHLKNLGNSTVQVLSKHLPKLIATLDFPKKMRWADLSFSYPRPLHWIVALYDSSVVQFEVASVHSGRHSRGHAQLCPQSFEITNASKYLSCLLKVQVIVDIEARKQSILKQLTTIESETNTHALARESVLSQVLFLSEYPQLTWAVFDPLFLKIPKEVLISEMVSHQKYFPLANPQGTLTNLFIITADNTPNERIKEGNQNVLSARLADGAFLYEQDLKTSLDTFSQTLDQVIFQKELGTVADKRDRISELALTLARTLNIPKQTQIKRGAFLCKADLVTALVQEFPELQGTIGKHYATSQQEDPEVALAIEEHWMPKGEGGALPTTQTGALLSLADKLDNLISYFSLRLQPTSSSDPYALRRQTLGILKILIEKEWSLNLPSLLKSATLLLPSIQNPQELIQTLLLYFTKRAKGLLVEEFHFKKDEIEASLQGICTNPYDQYLKTRALHLFRQTKTFHSLYEVYKRAKGQIENQKRETLSPDLLTAPAEQALHEKLKGIEKTFRAALKKREYEVAFSELSKLQLPLAQLFDKVKILADDPKIRANRIALLQEVFSLFSPLLDFGKIQMG